MRCPFCGHHESRVVDSRDTDEGRAIRRRRECEECHQRFTTFERGEQVQVLIEKRSGKRELFEREKLIDGVVKACTGRPVNFEQIEKLADDVIETLLSSGGNVVRSADLGKEILERLRNLDEVAYLRFASVYKDFKELTDFERELGLLQKKIPPKERAESPKT